jgi:SAM-dependent methyltransferase
MKWDLDDPPPNEWEKGGVALLLDVIEHCNNPGLALRHVSQILLPGAFLILTTPNPLWSRSRFEALAKGLPTCFKQSDLDLNHHVFTPWPHILQRLLSDSGFAIRHYFTLDGKTNWPRPRAQLKYPARLLFAMLNKLVESRDPSACGMSYGILAVQPR